MYRASSRRFSTGLHPKAGIFASRGRKRDLRAVSGAIQRDPIAGIPIRASRRSDVFYGKILHEPDIIREHRSANTFQWHFFSVVKWSELWMKASRQ